MTFAVRLHASAQRDFYHAQAYYDAEAPEQTERQEVEVIAVLHHRQDSAGFEHRLL